MKRTNAQSIGELLDSLFKSPNVAKKIAEGSLPHVWREVTGDVVASATRQVRFVRGTLYVHVASSIVRSELMMQREALVRSINKKLGTDLVQSVVVQ
jgi:predicted nucleic acid-binding Zn ribbon protein